MSATRLVEPALFDADATALVGSVCDDCGTTAFPAQDGCSRCSGSAVRTTSLPTQGTLWAYTVQCFEPKRPYRTDGAFTPFGLGYVDLGAVIVESRLTVADVDALRPGLPVRLVLEPLFTDEDGTTVLGFAFTPVVEEGDEGARLETTGTSTTVGPVVEEGRFETLASLTPQPPAREEGDA